MSDPCKSFDSAIHTLNNPIMFHVVSYKEKCLLIDSML